MDVAIEVKNLHKEIKGKKIIRNLSFQVYKGEVFGFIGPNGAGKTTTIRMMLGLISITKGEVFLCGNSIQDSKKGALQSIGAIIETPQLYPYMTGRQNIKLFATLHKVKSQEKIQQVIELVGLNEAMDKKVSEYSLGMKQRLGIAQAILHDPEILILDEPTNGLDPAGIHEMREYLRHIAKEKRMSVMVSSHLLNEIELMCDRVGIIKDGELVTVEAVQDQKGEEDTYTFHVLQEKEALDVLSKTNITVLEARNQDISITCREEMVPALVRELVKANIDIFYIEKKRTRLEDRFMKVTK